VRPDVPVAATDHAAFSAPVWSGEPITASAHTQHPAGRWGYVVVCNVGNDKEQRDARVALESAGEDRPESGAIAVYDWRRRRVDVLPPSGAYDVSLAPAGWDYRVLAPMLPGGIAVFGDPALYACAGDARIADVAADTEDGRVTVTVLGAGERVHIVGYAENAVSARAWTAEAGTAELASTFDPTTGIWDVAVDIGHAGWVKLHIDARG
jgi:hypothetical protein